MAHCNTIASQLLKFVPRHEFECLANQHHVGRAFRTASRWSQFVTMGIAQLSGRSSLRDIVENVDAQRQRLYHLGTAKLSRSNLARMNEGKPYQLYEDLFGVLLKRCQAGVSGHGFRFKNPLYSLDATTIDLCLSLFPWAKFRETKGAIKMHVGMNHKGNLPEFITVTEGKRHDVKEGRRMNFPKGSIVAMDRGYTDYKWYKELSDKGIYFVTRLKKNATVRIVSRRDVDKSTGLTSDQTIEIYKSRWEIELFFKWIKQNLKIKSFFGTSKNAVLTQIWIAMCVYLLLSYLKFQSKTNKSLQQILRLLQTNLFEKWSLNELITGRMSERFQEPILQTKLF